MSKARAAAARKANVARRGGQAEASSSASLYEAQHCEDPLLSFALTSPKRPAAPPGPSTQGAPPITGGAEQALQASSML